MEKIKDSIGDLLRLVIAMSGNHEDPSKELNKITKGKSYSIYLDTKWWDKACNRARTANEKREDIDEDYDITVHIKSLFNVINSIEKENREYLIYDITGIIFADGKLTESEETFWGLVSEHIDLTDDEILAQRKNYSEDLKLEIKKIKDQNEFMYAFAYPYWLIISADGDLNDEEVKNLNNESKMLKKYSGPAATLQCEDNFKPELKWDMENDDPEIGKKKYKNRIKASIDIINERLSKNDLKEVIYELNKLMLSDNNLHENEQIVFSLICEYIDLTQEETIEVLAKVTEELKEKLKTINSEPIIEKSNSLNFKETINKNSSTNKSSDYSFSSSYEKNEKNSSSAEWYNTYWVLVWLFLFWPVGVYGLLKKFKIIK